MLQILHSDPHLVAINKPHGLLVHKTPIAKDATEWALQTLRNQIGQHVYPTHRLDRKTGGVLLFAKDEESNSLMQKQFADRKIQKTYLAIVRGHTPDHIEIDYPLINEKGVSQTALTQMATLQKIEIPISSGRYPTSRYSLVQLVPKTGRMHQLRKHLAHVLHPIIGDRPHGCNKQNRFFKSQFDLMTMLLHASELSFDHPIDGTHVVISAPLQSEFQRMMKMLGFDYI